MGIRRPIPKPSGDEQSAERQSDPVAITLDSAKNPASPPPSGEPRENTQTNRPSQN